MQALLRNTARRLPRAFSEVSQKRLMSGGATQEEHIKEMHKWRYITMLAVPGCIGMVTYTFMHHEHDHRPPEKYPYLRIRNKEFPWGDCALFDSECEF